MILSSLSEIISKLFYPLVRNKRSLKVVNYYVVSILTWDFLTTSFCLRGFLDYHCHVIFTFTVNCIIYFSSLGNTASVKLKRTRLKLAFLARLKQCRLASLDEWLLLSLCLTKMDGLGISKGISEFSKNDN